MWYDSTGAVMLTEDQLIELLMECRGQVILLEGPTGCGKTRLMRRLVNEDRRQADLFTKDQFIRMLMDCTRSNGRHTVAEVVDGCEIVCIDDADLMSGAVCTQEYTAQILSEIAQKTLVVVAGIKLCERIKVLIENVNVPVRLVEYRSEHGDGI